MRKRILVVEDYEATGELMQMVLELGGYEVTWILGVNSISGASIEAILPDRSTATINVANFSVAFVDGKILGQLSGWDLVPALIATGVIAIAYSNTDNAELVKAGAQIAADKMKFVQENEALLAQAETLRLRAAS